MKGNDVHIEHGELRRMRDPRTGQLKEVDMSLTALSRTMENIRKSADIINKPDTSFETAMNRFVYIKELVLDHAQFSPKLHNLEIRIGQKIIEVVKKIEDLDESRNQYAKNYFFNKAELHLKKGRAGAATALDIMEKCKRYVENDPQVDEFIAELKGMIK